MKSSKVMAALVTLGLAAAVAAPAMALENQISGAFTSFYDLSNYSANFGQKNPAKDAPTENYFVQRVRLGYTAKATDDVKLVTKFELDYAFWGNNSYTTGRNTGGALGADSVNIETKNLYLDLNLPYHLNTRIGMQGYYDSFKGFIFDADMAGILLSHEYENAGVALGFFRFGDRTNTPTDYSNLDTIGKYTQDMLSLDGKYNISKATKIGAAYYYFSDNRATPADVKVHTIGLNGETLVGPVTLSGFVLTQFGDLSNTQKAKGFAFNIGGKMPLAGGTIRSELIYAGGGKNALYIPKGSIGAEGGGFYHSEMIMLNRDKNATTLDTAIVYDSNNNNQGVIMGSLGYDYNFTSKLSGSVNAGFAAVAKDNATLGSHKTNYLGTEINCEANYKILPTVTFGARAGYVVLGDYFKGTGADNPYDVKLLAKFAF